jgi:hypothetical protein
MRTIDEEPARVPYQGWAEMIPKVYEVDPLICPRCGGRMKVVAFLTEYAVVERIIRHLTLTFVAEKPPFAYALEQLALMAAGLSKDYEERVFSRGKGKDSDNEQVQPLDLAPQPDVRSRGLLGASVLQFSDLAQDPPQGREFLFIKEAP